MCYAAVVPAPVHVHPQPLHVLVSYGALLAIGEPCALALHVLAGGLDGRSSGLGLQLVVLLVELPLRIYLGSKRGLSCFSSCPNCLG